tara:strand:+ start:195 stop:980 length:786 start_codon:yes stop_codon:yes gene_type:complete
LIKAKKSLGQNFLTDKNVLDKIINLISIENKNILEIGPGTGNLTSLILEKKPKKFIVIEKDNILANKLQKKFKDEIIIFNKDVLKFDENLLMPDKFVVFGNLPYNISTEIISNWITNLKNDFWFTHLILMFQKEVADRIIAKYNTSAYGRLTILTNWKLDVEKIFDIKPESFLPKPKIDSSLLIFTPKKNYFHIKNPKNLEKITKVFFNHRRKMLKKPFNQLFNGDQKIMQKLKIDLRQRPQNLNCEIYYKLTNEYESLKD